MEDDLAEAGRVEELVHLRVVREEHALLPEAAVVLDPDQEAVARVDPRRGREVDPLADVHPGLPELGPAPLEPGRLEPELEAGGPIERPSDHARPSSRNICLNLSMPETYCTRRAGSEGWT